MGKVLIAYASNAGSTADVAKRIGEVFLRHGDQADVIPLAQIPSLEGYSQVVLGGPMIMGWHRGALGFLRRHQAALSQVPLALFITAMSLTQTGESQVDGVPILVDNGLAKSPAVPGRLTFRERYATPENYLRPILKAAPAVRPVQAAFFGGRLDFYRLAWYQALFVMLIIQAQPGERRNWGLIEGWAEKLAVGWTA